MFQKQSLVPNPWSYLPVVSLGELLVGGIVVAAPESVANLALGKITRALGPVGVCLVSVGSITALVVLADTVVLTSKVPVDVDGAHGALVVRLGVGLEVSDLESSDVSLGDVGAGLGGDLHVDAKVVVEGDLLPGARVVFGFSKEARYSLRVEESSERKFLSGKFNGDGSSRHLLLELIFNHILD